MSAVRSAVSSSGRRGGQDRMSQFVFVQYEHRFWRNHRDASSGRSVASNSVAQIWFGRLN
eukprot:scaffold187650_cov56-Prasinocladus_malaysianus.AAC.1